MKNLKNRELLNIILSDELNISRASVVSEVYYQLEQNELIEGDEEFETFCNFAYDLYLDIDYYAPEQIVEAISKCLTNGILTKNDYKDHYQLAVIETKARL